MGEQNKSQLRLRFCSPIILVLHINCEEKEY